MVVNPVTWCSGKPNNIEGKLIWFSLLFYPVMAYYGSTMVAKKESLFEKFANEKNRTERDSAQAYWLISKIKSFAFSLLTVKNKLVLTKKKYVLES